MINPPINSLMEKVDSRYTLCILAGKRARQITNGAQPNVKCNSQKALTIAVHEIDEMKISYSRKKQSLLLKTK